MGPLDPLIGRIVQGDCIAQMDALPAGCVDLVFADPPFNIGYDYDVYHDKKERDDYLAWSRRWPRRSWPSRSRRRRRPPAHVRRATSTATGTATSRSAPRARRPAERPGSARCTSRTGRRPT